MCVCSGVGVCGGVLWLWVGLWVVWGWACTTGVVGGMGGARRVCGVRGWWREGRFGVGIVVDGAVSFGVARRGGGACGELG